MAIEKLAENVYEIAPKTLMARVYGKIEKFHMFVPVHIYANERILQEIKEDKTLEQICNVACLPGVKKHVVALSDAHQGYGFCIGAVAGTNKEDGMISPGGVGYDINCGVRLLKTDLIFKDIQQKLPELLNTIFKNIPSGLGSRGKIKINHKQLDQILDHGMQWTLEKEFATEKDLLHCEENGKIEEADSEFVSRKAKVRGIKQLGTLGSGNHFIEIQKVDKIYDQDIAEQLGIFEKDQVTVMIHTGSRALGHQVCTESIRTFEKGMKEYDIKIPDRELACLPANKTEAINYLHQMGCAANFGFVNRQIITYLIRRSFEYLLAKQYKELNIDLIYGLCHNILKKEIHKVNKKNEELFIHRKGATRAFPAEHPVLPKDYRTIGQPVLIPGTMGSASYLCIGGPRSMELSFGSTVHGSGRVMSRSKATRNYWGKKVEQDLKNQGILVRAASMKVIAEEAPKAYKDIDQVININHSLGIIKKVVKLIPVGVVKG